MENHENDQQFKKIQEELKEIRSKYNTVSGDVKTLKNSQSDIQDNMGIICSSLEKMSKSVEEMMNRLNSITEEQQKSAVENMMHKKGGMFSALVKKPLRKLAVGTVGAIMAVGESTAEIMANAKEGMEDIVAEANYNRKTKRQEQQAQA